ncbi:MAG: site-specific integrase [Gordonia amarae]
MDKIETEGKPHWQVKLRVGKDPRTGKWRWTKRKFPTERAALDYYDKTKRAVKEGSFALPTGDTVDEVVKAWLASRHKTRATTKRSDAYDIEPLRQVYGALPIQQLTRVHVDALLADLKRGGVIPTPKSDPDKPRYRRPNAPRSLNKTLEAIENLLDYALSRKLISRNPAVDVERFAKSKPKIVTLTLAEIEKVLAQGDKERDAQLYHLALSGFRREDIAGLRWSDVDLAKGTVRLENARVQNAGTVDEGPLKTVTSHRTLVMDAELIRVLKAAKLRQKQDKLAAGGAYKDGLYVLCNAIGEPERPDHLYRRWTRCLRLAGVPHVRLHDARHSCATLMQAHGVPLAVIAAWLGHSSPDITARLYLHSDAEALRDAANAMAAIRGSSSAAQ